MMINTSQVEMVLTNKAIPAYTLECEPDQIDNGIVAEKVRVQSVSPEMEFFDRIF